MPCSSSSGTQNQNACVWNVLGGSSSSWVSITSCFGRPRRWYASTCSVTDTSPNDSSTPSMAVPEVWARVISVIVELLTCVYHFSANGCTRATRSARSSSDTQERLAHVQVDGALVDGAVARSCSTVPSTWPVSVSTIG